jgi:rare lipoprotein A
VKWGTMIAAALWVAAPLLLTSCGKPHVGYSPSDRTYDSAPSSSPSNQTAMLPSGKGGYKKVGKPYRVAGHWYYPLAYADGYDETGVASWYGTKFHGKKTANGERYDMHAMSAAHKTLPLPTMVRVTNLKNGRSVVVRVNDRGPFVKDRIIDLSYAAARKLGYNDAGTAPVRVEVLGNSSNRPSIARSKPAPVVPPHPIISTRPTPTATTLTTKPGAMYIQLGAFSSHNNANKLQGELSGEYPSVGIYTINGGYSKVYRVRIGPFNDEKDIEDNVLSLQQRGYDNAIVVIE